MGEDRIEGRIGERHVLNVRRLKADVGDPSLRGALFRDSDARRVAVDAHHFAGSERLGQSERDGAGAAPAVEERHPRPDVWQEERGLARYSSALEIPDGLGVMTRHRMPVLVRGRPSWVPLLLPSPCGERCWG